jgi:hypothetical protein
LIEAVPLAVSTELMCQVGAQLTGGGGGQAQFGAVTAVMADSFAIVSAVGAAMDAVFQRGRSPVSWDVR